MFEFMPSQDEVVAQIMAWAETNARHAGPNQLTCVCSDSDTERIALFEQHGFVATVNRALSMVRLLHQPIPVPQLPGGFVIGHLEGEHEVETLVALHRAAFGTENMTANLALL